MGIAELMKALKLTHGGFYRHFKNKDALFAAALEDAFVEMRARVKSAVQHAPPGHEVQAIVKAYLSDAHCADAGGGCPVAALSQEVARHSPAVRKAFDRAIQDSAAAIGRFMSGRTEEERTRKAAVLLSGMAGTLSLARAVSDDRLRRDILAAARRVYTEAFAKDR